MTRSAVASASASVGSADGVMAGSHAAVSPSRPEPATTPGSEAAPPPGSTTVPPSGSRHTLTAEMGPKYQSPDTATVRPSSCQPPPRSASTSSGVPASSRRWANPATSTSVGGAQRHAGAAPAAMSTPLASSKRVGDHIMSAAPISPMARCWLPTRSIGRSSPPDDVRITATAATSAMTTTTPATAAVHDRRHLRCTAWT